MPECRISSRKHGWHGRNWYMSTKTAPQRTPYDSARCCLEFYFEEMDEKRQSKLRTQVARQEVQRRFIDDWLLVLGTSQVMKRISDPEKHDAVAKELHPIEQRLSMLIELAETDPLTWDALAASVCILAEEGHPLPSKLGPLIGKLMSGKLKKPAKRGASLLSYRDYAICTCIDMLTREFHGLHPTKNESKEDGICASDVVAKVLGDFGENLKTRAVEKVWENRDKHVRK